MKRLKSGLYEIEGLLVQRESHSELTRRINDRMNSRRHYTIWVVYRQFSALDDGSLTNPTGNEYRSLKEAKIAITKGKEKL